MRFENVPVNHNCSGTNCILKKKKKVAQGLIKALAVIHAGVSAATHLFHADHVFVPLLILLL